MHTRNRIAIAVISIFLIAVAIRAMMPLWVRNYVNEQLHALNGYDGRIVDVDLALWRGAYQIEGLVILREAARQEPFFSADAVNLSIEWRNLLRGKVVGSAYFEQPVLRAIQAESTRETQLGKGVNWFGQLKDLFPFQFNTIGIRNGTVFFRAPGIASEDAIRADNVQGQITNLTNVAGKAEEAFAGFEVTADVLDHAPLAISGKTNPLAMEPTFDVNLELEGVRLVALNPWLQAYAGVDAEAGTFELATEIAARDGKFAGYVKPLMQDVEIHGKGDDSKNALHQIWEGFVDLLAEVFENQPKEQVATRIPLSGTLEDPHAGILAAIGGVLKNAFVGAFARSLENSISLTTLDSDSRRLIEDKALRSGKNAAQEKEGQRRVPERRAGPRAGPT